MGLLEQATAAIAAAEARLAAIAAALDDPTGGVGQRAPQADPEPERDVPTSPHGG
jgi:hypothetical protein